MATRRARSRDTRGINLLGLGVAVLLLAVGLYDDGPKQFASGAQAMLGAASVSTTAAVPVTPENTIAAQLAAKEARLNQEEARITAERGMFSRPADIFGVASFLMSIFLFALVAINFYLDTVRNYGSLRAAAFSVDLRRR